MVQHDSNHSQRTPTIERGNRSLLLSHNYRGEHRYSAAERNGRGKHSSCFPTRSRLSPTFLP